MRYSFSLEVLRSFVRAMESKSSTSHVQLEISEHEKDENKKFILFAGEVGLTTSATVRVGTTCLVNP